MPYRNPTFSKRITDYFPDVFCRFSYGCRTLTLVVNLALICMQVWHFEVEKRIEILRRFVHRPAVCNRIKRRFDAEQA